MGRHVAGECPQLDRLVDEACASIGREVSAMKMPRLAGVVLGGGYGRGEGGALIKEEGKRKKGKGVMGSSNAECRLSNDLDFFAVTEPGVSEAEAVAEISAALEPVSKKWTAELGVDVDFAVKTPWRLKHDEERLMVQELLRGYFDVAGRKGEELFAGIRRVDAADLPWSEAARLLMNRGMGLLLAKEAAAKGLAVEVDGGRAVSTKPPKRGGIIDAALPDAVTLKFASSGSVTAKLGSYSCSSVLIPVASDDALSTSRYALFLYFAPKANKFDGYSAEVRLEWDGSAFSSVEE